MIGGTVTGVEQYRGELQGVSVLALAADPDVPDHQAAKVALGLEPRAEHDAEPACDWCGRSAPAGGLEDQSMGGPASFECHDGTDCQEARQAAEPMWLDKQFKFWRIDWDKYRRIQQYQAEQAARTRFGSGIYALSQGVEDAEFLVALGHVRDLVDQRAAGYLESFERVGEKALELAAGIHDPATSEAEPEQVPEPVKFDQFAHTLRNPANRTHLLGHHLQHKGVTDAAAAMAHRDVQARQAEGSS